ncbi:MAG: 2-isopropylmalate synthase, partial [Candidatus Lindowbacteria bacterium]|nr:2-isopropylmalate synthase [Candidatus Lindowbacteria bacterium]
PDTVGFQVPAQIGMIFKTLKDRVPNIEKAILSAHCHNDLGLAVANSLAAVENGARQIECTINGIGERAGNCSLEEVVMALRVRGDAYGVGTTIKTQEIYRTSRLVTSMTGLLVQRNKAIIGANAFAHEAGIHQDGMLKDANTYEIMRPEDVGVPSSELVLGKHSGRHAFSTRLEEIGFSLSAEQIDKAFERFKRVADKKKEMFDEDLEAIVEDEVFKIGECFKLDYLEVSAGTIKNPTAKIRIEVEGEIKEESSSGDGPVDATYQAINKVTGIKTELSDYRIKAITRGRDALGEVSVSIKADDYKFTGRGASTDIIEASAKAYINALNRFVAQKKRAETRAQTDSAGI